MKQLSIAKARNGFPTLVKDAENGSPIELTRRGQPVVVVISIEEYKRLKAKTPSFWESYQTFRKQNPQILIETNDLENLRDKSFGREVLL